MVKTSGKRGHRNVELTIKVMRQLKQFIRASIASLNRRSGTASGELLCSISERNAERFVLNFGFSCPARGSCVFKTVSGFTPTHAMSSLDLFAPISKAGRAKCSPSQQMPLNQTRNCGNISVLLNIIINCRNFCPIGQKFILQCISVHQKIYGNNLLWVYMGTIAGR